MTEHTLASLDRAAVQPQVFVADRAAVTVTPQPEAETGTHSRACVCAEVRKRSRPLLVSCKHAAQLHCEHPPLVSRRILSVRRLLQLTLGGFCDCSLSDFAVPYFRSHDFIDAFWTQHDIS